MKHGTEKITNFAKGLDVVQMLQKGIEKITNFVKGLDSKNLEPVGLNRIKEFIKGIESIHLIQKGIELMGNLIQGLTSPVHHLFQAGLDQAWKFINGFKEAKFWDRGFEAIVDWLKGGNNLKDNGTVENAGKAHASILAAGLGQPGSTFGDIGRAHTINWLQGMESLRNNGTVFNSGRSIGAAAADGVRANDFFGIGWWFTKGVLDGMWALHNNGTVSSACQAMGAAFLAQTRASMGIASPSKYGLAYGENFVGSIIMGVKRQTPPLVRQAEQMARAFVRTFDEEFEGVTPLADRLAGRAGGAGGALGRPNVYQGGAVTVNVPITVMAQEDIEKQRAIAKAEVDRAFDDLKRTAGRTTTTYGGIV